MSCLLPLLASISYGSKEVLRQGSRGGLEPSVTQMPPKSQKPASSKAKPSDEAKEEPLQAVVVADTFESKFAPFALERPRCLLQLANVPLIEYTLEFLASAGVQECYIYAGAHVDQIETYVNASRWNSSSSPFQKFIFLRCAATCVGDVMRDLDQKHILVGDFLVVSGDVICDFPIERAMRKHKMRKEKDKNAIMTMLLRESGTTSARTLPTFVIDPSRDRCLHYEESQPSAAYGLHIDPEMLKSAELDIRQDLVDCRIDICTPDVLSLWSDNFDNQSPRKDFLYGILKDYELNGKTVHTYIAQSHFAARVADLPAYAKLSDHILEGSVSGFRVDHSIFPDAHYSGLRDGPKYGRNVIRSRPVHIDSRSIIGAETSIGANTTIRSSVTGQRCHISKNVTIEASYVWDDVTIGRNAKIHRAIIGSEAFIGDDCIIGEGALISFGVQIASGTHIPPGVRITKAVHSGGQVESDKELVGTEGVGHEYDDEDEDDNGESAGPSRLIYPEAAYADSASTLASDMSEPSSPINGSRSQSFATSISDDDVNDRFQHDTVAILLQRMQEGKQADDMLSELMGLRFSGGADEVQVRKAVAGAMGRRISSQIEEGVPAADASRRTLHAYHHLVRRPQTEQTSQEQVDFILDLQRELTRRREGGKVLLFMTKDLYDLEVFGEETFLRWWKNPESNAEPEMVEVRRQTEQFIEWLESAESESEDEESD